MRFWVAILTAFWRSAKRDVTNLEPWEVTREELDNLLEKMTVEKLGMYLYWRTGDYYERKNANPAEFQTQQIHADAQLDCLWPKLMSYISTKHDLFHIVTHQCYDRRIIEDSISDRKAAVVY